MSAASILNKEIAGYRLIQHIGSGGMGDVYKAYHTVLGRTAAVKILHQKEYANRFRNEAYIQSGVNHPNIARLYESVLTGEYPCIIMEYVEGTALDEYLHRKGKLSSNETEQLIAQVSAALAYLHQKDILHRDIKPANFKVQPDGTVKMLDFGIAKHKYTPRFTQEGFLVGTTEYMAPEQFEQKPEKKSDIWSLGVMTYELLTGYLPFEASNPITLRAKISRASFTDPRILVPEISERLKIVIEKTIRIQPAARINADQLARLFHSDTAAPKKLKLPEMPKLFSGKKLKWPELSKWMQPGILLYAGVSAVLVILIVLFVGNNRPDPPPFPQTNPKPALDAGSIKVRVNVPSVSNAIIVFPNGRTEKVPYSISGKEGQLVDFVLKAPGYADRNVRLEITNRRSYYDITLDKINY